MQPSVSRFAIPLILMFVKKLGRLFSLFAAGFLATPIFALEVTEPAGAAHGYPGLCDMNGKKLANGEFRQWVENKRLHVIITYKFPAGELYEEQVQFRQQPELIQEKWSWKESKNGKSQREFAADFCPESLAHTSAKSTRMCRKR